MPLRQTKLPINKDKKPSVIFLLLFGTPVLLVGLFKPRNRDRLCQTVVPWTTYRVSPNGRMTDSLLYTSSKHA